MQVRMSCSMTRRQLRFTEDPMYCLWMQCSFQEQCTADILLEPNGGLFVSLTLQQLQLLKVVLQALWLLMSVHLLGWKEI